jgi:hypothetical protein
MAEEVQTALRVGRSPLQWDLANGKAPKVLPTPEKLLLNVEALSDARTPLEGFATSSQGLSQTTPLASKCQFSFC